MESSTISKKHPVSFESLSIRISYTTILLLLCNEIDIQLTEKLYCHYDLNNDNIRVIRECINEEDNNSLLLSLKDSLINEDIKYTLIIDLCWICDKHDREYPEELLSNISEFLNIDNDEYEKILDLCYKMRSFSKISSEYTLQALYKVHFINKATSDYILQILNVDLSDNKVCKLIENINSKWSKIDIIKSLNNKDLLSSFQLFASNQHELDYILTNLSSIKFDFEYESTLNIYLYNNKFLIYPSGTEKYSNSYYSNVRFVGVGTAATVVLQGEKDTYIDNKTLEEKEVDMFDINVWNINFENVAITSNKITYLDINKDSEDGSEIKNCRIDNFKIKIIDSNEDTSVFLDLYADKLEALLEE